jgi:hypothetical protein
MPSRTSLAKPAAAPIRWLSGCRGRASAVRPPGASVRGEPGGLVINLASLVALR